MNTEKTTWISDQGFFRLVVVITIAVMGLVTLLQYLPADMRPTAEFAKVLPFTNAVLNSLVSIALILGFQAIKAGKKGIHQAYMLTAFILSTVFLLSYVTYHTCTEHTVYGGTGGIKYAYYFVLATHIVLAAAVLPMVLYTMYYSTSGQFAKHKKWARVTFPIWLYVSVTGVIVYFMIAPYYAFKYYPF
jgi:putative membrane protein